MAGNSTNCTGSALAAALAVAIVNPQSAVAAQRPPVDFCSMSALLQAGAGREGFNVSVNGVKHHVYDGPLAFGEAAMLYGCGAFVAQADSAAYGHWANANGLRIHNVNGHIGGALLLQNVDQGRMGLAASYLVNGFKQDSLSVSSRGTGWRAGGFVEFSGNDWLSLGGGIHAFDVRNDVSIGESEPRVLESGAEGEAVAQLYPAASLSLSLRGDWQLATVKFGDNAKQRYNGMAVSVEAEYLVPQTALSIFGGARYTHIKLSQTDDAPGAKINYPQAYAGLKFSFGGPPPQSLRERDRRAPYDNTSLFREKLPNLVFSSVASAGTE